MSSTLLVQAALAGDYLLRDCLSRFGMPWTVRHHPAPTGSPYARLYGLLDPTEAAQYGYHPPPGATDVQDRPSEEPTLDHAIQAVLDGRGPTTIDGIAVPPGGCLGEARRKLEAGAPPIGTEGQPGLATQLAGQASDLAEKDSRVQAVWASWSECMTKAGFNYPDPWAANNDPSWSQSKTPTPREIATAEADVSCRVEVSLVGTWYAVEVAYQKRAIEQHAVELASWKQYIEVYQRNVAAVVANG